MRHSPVHIVVVLQKYQGAVRPAARELGVSPGTVLNWKRRAMSPYGRLSCRRIRRHSTAPHHRPRSNILTLKEQRAVTELRQKTGWGALQLHAALGLSVHPASIYRFLKRQGLIRRGTQYRRPRYQDTTHKGLHNVCEPGVVQMDVKYVTPRLSGLVHTTFLYAVIDVRSRYKAGSIWESLDSETAVAALEWCLHTLPFPVTFVQTDNGLEFQREFEQALTVWQLPHHFIHKSSPNENEVFNMFVQLLGWCGRLLICYRGRLSQPKRV